MHRQKWLLACVLVLPVVLFLQADAAADMPDAFTNLQILPEDISKDELKGIMNGFTEMLDVKCTFCHTLDEYDNDDNKHKVIARDMIVLVDHLRDNIGIFFPEKTDPGTLTCWTCHRGEAEIEPFAPEEGEDW